MAVGGTVTWWHGMGRHGMGRLRMVWHGMGRHGPRNVVWQATRAGNVDTYVCQSSGRSPSFGRVVNVIIEELNVRVPHRLRIGDIDRVMVSVAHTAAAALRYVTGVVLGREVVVTSQGFSVEILGVREACDGVV